VHLTVDVGALAPEVALTEPEDCKHFDVIVRGTTDGAELDRVLIATSVGRIEGSDALIGVDAVRRLASGSVGVDWEGELRRHAGLCWSTGLADRRRRVHPGPRGVALK
jgi:hypothetical protein